MVKHTRKTIARNSKKDLLKFARDNGLDVKTSMSKKIIVDIIFKNKSVRALVPEKEKRKLSEKQRANLERFRFKKTKDKVLDDSAKISKPIEVAAPSKPNPQSKVKIDPTASNKNEPAPESLKQNPTTQIKQSKKVAEGTIQEKDLSKAKVQTFIKDKEPITDFKTGEKKENQEVKSLQTKIDVKTRDKASAQATKLKQGLGGTQFDANRQRALDSHTVRLRKNIYLNAKKKVSSVREHAVSTEKSTDYFDRRMFNKITTRNKEQMKKAIQLANRNQEAGFVGEVADITGDGGFNAVEDLLELEAQYKLGKITKQQYQDGIERIRFMREASAKGLTKEQSERLLVQHLEQNKDDKVAASYIRIANKQDEVDRIDLLTRLKQEKALDNITTDLVNNIIEKSKQELTRDEEMRQIRGRQQEELDFSSNEKQLLDKIKKRRGDINKEKDELIDIIAEEQVKSTISQSEREVAQDLKSLQRKLEEGLTQQAVVVLGKIKGYKFHKKMGKARMLKRLFDDKVLDLEELEILSQMKERVIQSGRRRGQREMVSVFDQITDENKIEEMMLHMLSNKNNRAKRSRLKEELDNQ